MKKIPLQLSFIAFLLPLIGFSQSPQIAKHIGIRQIAPIHALFGFETKLMAVDNDLGLEPVYDSYELDYSKYGMEYASVLACQGSYDNHPFDEIMLKDDVLTLIEEFQYEIWENEFKIQVLKTQSSGFFYHLGIQVMISNDEFEVFSKNNSSNINNDQAMHFQIWAYSLEDLKDIYQEIIRNLEEEGLNLSSVNADKEDVFVEKRSLDIKSVDKFQVFNIAGQNIINFYSYNKLQDFIQTNDFKGVLYCSYFSNGQRIKSERIN